MTFVILANRQENDDCTVFFTFAHLHNMGRGWRADRGQKMKGNIRHPLFAIKMRPASATRCTSVDMIFAFSRRPAESVPGRLSLNRSRTACGQMIRLNCTAARAYQREVFALPLAFPTSSIAYRRANHH